MAGVAEWRAGACETSGAENEERGVFVNGKDGVTREPGYDGEPHGGA